MTSKCWNGKILCVDLAAKSTREEKIPASIYESFIGGKGLGAYLLYSKTRKGIDPLGSENILLFMSGPLQGLPAPNVGRWSLITKSPLTGLFIDTHCGGAIGREIKKAGYDVICVEGKSQDPIVIVIENNEVKFEDASTLWGKGVYETTKEIDMKYGNDHAVYVIGPAGENEVLSATGCCEIAHQTGRGGAGAVLGSKNLKGIVVKGTSDILAVDIEEIRLVNKEFNHAWKNLDIDFKKHGTRHLVELANQGGQFPARNFQNGYFEEYEELGHLKMEEEFESHRKYSCPNCVMRCTHAFTVENPHAPNYYVESALEYETIGLLGGNLGISDAKAVLQLNYLCDDIGLDTISAGGAIGFAMEAFEKGILTEDDIGFPLNFGDSTGAMKLLELISERKGIGKTLAQGVKKAAEIIGKGSEKLAVHVKGLEVPAWDPRGRVGMGLLYATGDIGASHLRGWPPTSATPDTSAVPVVEGIWKSRLEKILKDCLIVCHFTNRIPLSMEQMIRALNGASGLEYDMESIDQVGRRIETLARLYNVREGIDRKDDVLPPRFWEAQISGPRKGMKAFKDLEDFNSSLDRYYEIMGWDKNGIPTNETLVELGLSDLV
ncbi:MAG: aldehyde ferredoxin oxidoreductase family protein [Candidatus Thorarchaeota archaeon]